MLEKSGLVWLVVYEDPNPKDLLPIYLSRADKVHQAPLTSYNREKGWQAMGFGSEPSSVFRYSSHGRYLMPTREQWNIVWTTCGKFVI